MFITLPETNISPENGWLEDSFPFGKAYFQGRAVSFREGMCLVVCPYANIVGIIEQFAFFGVETCNMERIGETFFSHRVIYIF